DVLCVLAEGIARVDDLVAQPAEPGAPSAHDLLALRRRASRAASRVEKYEIRHRCSSLKFGLTRTTNIPARFRLSCEIHTQDPVGFNRGPVSLRLATRVPRRCVVCRHVGVAVRALEARDLPRAAAAAYVVAVLRRALPDGRGQQHVLQPA